MIPAIRLRPPIIAGAELLILGGNDDCAKLAVPVIVDSTMTGNVKRILCFLNTSCACICNRPTLRPKFSISFPVKGAKFVLPFLWVGPFSFLCPY